MKYIKPTYKNECLETEDVILASISLDGGATLVEKDSNSARVSTSVFDILGMK